ncbi:MogA/MoaB family molybdenum cofactor biosynthesis protein [Virgibacillus sp. NKC19-3]|uniref:MogA/MoaB family molybdenum cofactor biosynthesis protein n=1 Tax=Virgibacillus saliphilus TaxID=2831674 RepID=UPI001C9AE922|nr:MogA/MoaB family molybdenum cofactor biosynthesis protein [Virgibacillus sp. NKC19-3]MBY7142080.1 MogA/MoaB family molybdenum cofactor biosynthesis protein [Virgibacillus sp. NKC19-3]
MAHDHQKHSPVSCAVITVSDTRNKETDKSGKIIMELLSAVDHKVNMYEVISDERASIRDTIEKAITDPTIEAVIVNGGTGISYRDVTIESIQPLLDKELPGFGELFRYLSYQFDIGTASMLSRAICGVANNRIIFSTPGSSGAVKLAMERLILPELGHTVAEVNKDLPIRDEENRNS